MVVRFLCKMCNKTVSCGSDSIQCDKSDIWVDRQCHGLNKQTFEYLKKDNSKWFCMVCTKEFLPFSNLDDKNLILTVKRRKLKFTNVTEKWISSKTKLLDQINLITRTSAISFHSYNQFKQQKHHSQMCLSPSIYGRKWIQ